MESASPAWAPALSEVPAEFVTANLRGRRSRLYEGERLRELARLGSVADLAWRLFPRHELPDPFALERRLRSACTAELASVATYLKGRLRGVYCALLDRYAVENLKT